MAKNGGGSSAAPPWLCRQVASDFSAKSFRAFLLGSKLRVEGCLKSDGSDHIKALAAAEAVGAAAILLAQL